MALISSVVNKVIGDLTAKQNAYRELIDRLAAAALEAASRIPLDRTWAYGVAQQAIQEADNTVSVASLLQIVIPGTAACEVERQQLQAKAFFKKGNYSLEAAVFLSNYTQVAPEGVQYQQFHTTLTCRLNAISAMTKDLMLVYIRLLQSSNAIRQAQDDEARFNGEKALQDAKGDAEHHLEVAVIYGV